MPRWSDISKAAAPPAEPEPAPAARPNLVCAGAYAEARARAAGFAAATRARATAGTGEPEEASRAAAADTGRCSEPSDGPLEPGTRVTLRGLLGSRQAYNGARGKVLNFHEGTGRYYVELAGAGRAAPLSLSVRPDNLAPAPQPLEEAIRESDLFQVQALLRDRADPNATSSQGSPLILEACAASERRNLLALLLSFAADGADARELGAASRKEGEEVRQLCEIFRDRAADSDAKRALLASLDPGVLAHARKWLRLPGPFALDGVRAVDCLAQPEVMFDCESTVNHSAQLVKADDLRPVLVMSPWEEPPDALVVVLHGLFQSGQMLGRLVRELSHALPNARLIAPTAPTRRVWGVGPAWFNHLISEELPEQLEEQRLELLALLGQEHRIHGIGPERVVLVGFSMGGVLAAWTALQVPQTLAGLAILGCDGVTSPLLPPLPSQEGAAGLAVIQCHGEKDELVPPENAQRSADRLAEQGCDVDYITQPGVGHALSGEMITELQHFLSQRLAPLDP